MKAFIDANVFIFATVDEGSDGQNSRLVIDLIARGRIQAITSTMVIDKVMHALIKNKKVHLLENFTKNIYELPNLTIEGIPPEIPLECIHFIKAYEMGPHDAMNCQVMRKNNVTTIITDDRDFNKVKEVKRLPLDAKWDKILP